MVGRTRRVASRVRGATLSLSRCTFTSITLSNVTIVHPTKERTQPPGMQARWERVASVECRGRIDDSSCRGRSRLCKQGRFARQAGPPRLRARTVLPPSSQLYTARALRALLTLNSRAHTYHDVPARATHIPCSRARTTYHSRACHVASRARVSPHNLTRAI